MKRNHIRDSLFAAIEALTIDSRYYYKGMMGPSTSRLTDEGKTAIVDLITFYGYAIIEAHEKDLEERSKRYVLTQLSNNKGSE